MPKNKTTSFMDLPPELRVKIYQYVSPINTLVADYSGLPQTCRLIHKEWTWEARKSVCDEYYGFKYYLATQGIWLHETVFEALSTSRLTIELPAKIFEGEGATKIYLIPWHWTWITDVKVIFSRSCPAFAPDQRRWYHLYHYLEESMHKYIDANSLKKKLSHYTIKEITLCWYGVPDWLFAGHQHVQSAYRPFLWKDHVERGETGSENLSIVWKRRGRMDLYTSTLRLRAKCWLGMAFLVVLVCFFSKAGVLVGIPCATAGITLEALIAWYSFLYV
jgi:hypothetical protein